MAKLSEITEMLPISLAGALWGLAILYPVSVIIHRIFFHPLSKYPGPFFAKFTDIYPMLSMFNMNRILWQYDMLQKYGSPVRVATNELFFSDMKSWSDIYGQSSNPCLKEPSFYDSFTATGATSVLNERNRFQHARVRRLLSHGFSLKSLLQEESLVHEKVEEYIKFVIAPAAEKGQVVDIYTKMMEHYLDIVSYLSLGKSFDSVSGRGEVTHHDLDQLDLANGTFSALESMVVVPTQSFLPQLRYLPIKRIQEGYKGLSKLITFARTAVQTFTARLEKEGSDSSFAKGTFLRNLVEAVDQETGSKLTFEELVENAIIFLVAGSDTTAVTTCYAIWECGRRPECGRKLVEEIRSAFPDRKVVPTYDEASKLPYLNAVIEETLRLWGPLNAGFPRVSPGRMIGSQYIPAGVVVSTVPYATGRDPNTFPDPHTFNPDRWLHATADMKNMCRPFSYGPRNCIGKHLAEIGLHCTLTRLYQLYDIEICESMTTEMMRPKDRGVTAPWEAKLLVKPKRVGDEGSKCV